MPFDGNLWEPRKFVSYRTAIEHLKYGHGIELRAIEDKGGEKFERLDHQFDPNDTTKWYKVSETHLGRVGFITSMSRLIFFISKDYKKN